MCLEHKFSTVIRIRISTFPFTIQYKQYFFFTFYSRSIFLKYSFSHNHKGYQNNIRMNTGISKLTSLTVLINERNRQR